MEQDRFNPRFHFCTGGNHYHLVTGPNFSASPAFASVKTGEFLIDFATDPNDQRDIDDSVRLKQELRELKLRRGRRRGKLCARARRWEDHAVLHWHDLLKGKLRVNQSIGALLFFIHTPCDFVEKTVEKDASGQVHIRLHAKKVREFQ